MNIQELSKHYAKRPQVAALAKAVKEGKQNVFLEGLLASSAPLLFSSLAQQCSPVIFFILQDAEEAGYFYHDLTQLMGTERVLFFPSSYRRSVKYAQRDPANEILRTEVLTELGEKLRVNSDKFPAGVPVGEGMAAANSSLFTSHFSLYIVSYPEAVAEMVVSKQQLDSRTLVLEVGQEVSTATIEQTLQDFGFREVDYVYEPGQYALRGSILDVFSFSCEYPYRIDFFGDEIDSIRTFEVEDQLSKERRQQVEIVPDLAGLAEDKDSLFKFLPAETILAVKDYDFVADAVDRTFQEGFSRQAITERMERLRVGEHSSGMQAATELEQHDIEQQLRRECQLIAGVQFRNESAAFPRIEFGHRSSRSSSSVIRFNITPQPLFHKNFDLLAKTLTDYQLKGYNIFILADSQKQQERLKEILRESPLQPPPTGGGSQRRTAPPVGRGRGEAFIPVDKTLHEGFIDNDARACLLTDHQIFDRFHKYNLKSDKARTGKVALTLKEIQQFEIGDYVVHVDHGIGRFGGLVRMPITSPQGGMEGGFQEMIKITYQRGDAIYVSIHSLYKVSKYKSQDGGEAPRLSTLGTGQWERLKERTKKHIKDIARDLIKLYARRRREKGFAFSHDSYLQHELEASFLYEDTPDQLKATQDVKADMERPQPMDRLVCGDVGFGKTEVAVRAAFKAACDGKQVAVMVPTTVLAYQHFHTFSSRLKDMPVRVDYLTRARSTKQTTALLKDLEEGKIDILVGTHKLIGKTVKFHDLGLLIIDEEQKFGVATKEKLRARRCPRPERHSDAAPQPLPHPD